MLIFKQEWYLTARGDDSRIHRANILAQCFRRPTEVDAKLSCRVEMRGRGDCRVWKARGRGIEVCDAGSIMPASVESFTISFTAPVKDAA